MFNSHHIKQFRYKSINHQKDMLKYQKQLTEPFK